WERRGSAAGGRLWLPLLVLAAILVAVGSFYGGILVRGPGHLAF
ncbi:MAG: M50 family peptidase, partial [Gemmatimonadetes bacterium]|nr:M50 family peptidase [Gemmatimonadota bacterium]